MDLIERDSALEIVRRTSGDYAAAFSEIGRLPAADATLVVHGHWEWSTGSVYRCTACEERTRVDECMGNPVYQFCPYCGARMDEEATHEESDCS
jgi:DNA-directed RNA polymerase subunit RPC12/RpoP